MFCSGSFYFSFSAGQFLVLVPVPVVVSETSQLLWSGGTQEDCDRMWKFSIGAARRTRSVV